MGGFKLDEQVFEKRVTSKNWRGCQNGHNQEIKNMQTCSKILDYALLSLLIIKSTETFLFQL